MSSTRSNSTVFQADNANGTETATKSSTSAEATKTEEKESLIKPVMSAEELNELLKSIKDKYIVVEFYAAWCGPCKILATKLQEVAEKYQDKVQVLQIDIDILEELAIEYEVKAMPSYMILRDGEKLEQYFGSKPEQFDNMVQKYLEQSA